MPGQWVWEARRGLFSQPRRPLRSTEGRGIGVGVGLMCPEGEEKAGAMNNDSKWTEGRGQMQSFLGSCARPIRTFCLVLSYLLKLLELQFSQL